MATFWRSRRRISHAWAPLSMSVNDDNFDYFSLKVHEIEIFFGFDFEISLRFYLVIFASKRNTAKQNSSLFFVFFTFFHFFLAFFTFFRLIFVSLRFFHLIFAYFNFVFASDFWCFASKWIMWNQAFFSLPSETKFSLQFQISLPKRKWGRTLVGGNWSQYGAL